MFAVGTNVQRIDGAEKVAGQAVYAGDLRLPGMAYAKILRSPLPHARIRRIDASKASVLPGVLAVLTRDNLNVASNAFGAYVRDQQIIATDKVRYAGDMVAAVAATDAAIAEEAVRLIEVDYDELPAVFSIDDALKDGAPLVHEKLEGRKDPGYGRGGAHIIHDDSNILLPLPTSSRRHRRRFPRGGADFRRHALFSQRAALSDGAACLRRSFRSGDADGLVGDAEPVSGAPGVGARVRPAVQRRARDRAPCRRRLRRQERHQDRGHRRVFVASCAAGRCGSRSAPRRPSRLFASRAPR